MQQDERHIAASPGHTTMADVGDGSARFVILGQTSAGRTFRPSDWAERLAGVMAAFRPRKAGTQQHLTYSPYVVPSSLRGIKCVIVDPKLPRSIDRLTLGYAMYDAKEGSG